MGARRVAQNRVCTRCSDQSGSELPPPRCDACRSTMGGHSARGLSWSKWLCQSNVGYYPQPVVVQFDVVARV